MAAFSDLNGETDDLAVLLSEADWVEHYVYLAESRDEEEFSLTRGTLICLCRYGIEVEIYVPNMRCDPRECVFCRQDSPAESGMYISSEEDESDG